MLGINELSWITEWSRPDRCLRCEDVHRGRLHGDQLSLLQYGAPFESSGAECHQVKWGNPLYTFQYLNIRENDSIIVLKKVQY